MKDNVEQNDINTDGLKSVELTTMGVVAPEVELVTKEDLIRAFPEKSKTITDELVTYINMAQVDPQFDVLTMFGTFDPKLGKPFVKDDALISVGVVVVVGIIGEVKGQVAYSFSEETAKMIASTMMMGMPVDTFDEMAKSAVSELSNMISGNASTAIAAKGFIIDIAPPTLITGENMRLATNVKKSLVVPVSTTAGNIDIWVSLE